MQVDLDNFFCVVPRAPGVRHVDRLVQAEHRDRHQVADEEEGLDEGQGQLSRSAAWAVVGTNLIDKVLSCAIAWGIVKGVPRRIRVQFPDGCRVD